MAGKKWSIRIAWHAHRPGDPLEAYALLRAGERTYPGRPLSEVMGELRGSYIKAVQDLEGLAEETLLELTSQPGPTSSQRGVEDNGAPPAGLVCNRNGGGDATRTRRRRRA